MGYQIEIPFAGLKWVSGRRPGEMVIPISLWYEGRNPRDLARGGIPATIPLTLHPKLAPVSRFDLPLEQLPVTRHHLDVPGFGRAYANTVALSAEYERRYLLGDPRAVGQLMALNRGFELDPWVREARERDQAVQRSLSLRGRPFGSMDAMARGIALASYAQALCEETGESPNSVHRRLATASRLNMGYERIRQSCREWGPELRGKERSALFFADSRLPQLGIGW